MFPNYNQNSRIHSSCKIKICKGPFLSGGIPGLADLRLEIQQLALISGHFENGETDPLIAFWAELMVLSVHFVVKKYELS